MLDLGLDAIVLEECTGSVEGGNYNIVQLLCGILAMAIGIIPAPKWVAYANAGVRGHYAWIRNTFWRSLLASALVAGGVAIVRCALAGPIAARRVWNGITPPSSLVTALAAKSFALACGMAFSQFWNGMRMLGLQATLGGVFVLVSVPTKVASLPLGNAATLVVVNCIACPITALVPGAHATLGGRWLKPSTRSNDQRTAGAESR